MFEGKPTQIVFTIFNILEIIWFEPKCATFEPFCAVTLITFWKLISVICQLTGPAGLWLGCGWQILFQGKKRSHLATWTRPATCGRTWDTLLVITWEGMDRNRKQIDINISAMIHTYIKLIIKRLSCHNCNDAALLLVLVPTCQHVRLFSAIQPESAVILNPSSVFVSSMFVTRRTR